MSTQKGIQNEQYQPSNQEELLVRKLISKLQHATAIKNVQGVFDCYADGVTMYMLNPPLESVTIDRAVSARGLQDWFSAWKTDLKYFSREMHVSCSGDIAYAYGLTYMGGEKTNGEKTSMWFRETFGFIKTDDLWKITHHHQSVPMEMDGSGKAAIDLKPPSH